MDLGDTSLPLKADPSLTLWRRTPAPWTRFGIVAPDMEPSGLSDSHKRTGWTRSRDSFRVALDLRAGCVPMYGRKGEHLLWPMSVLDEGPINCVDLSILVRLILNLEHNGLVVQRMIEVKSMTDLMNQCRDQIVRGDDLHPLYFGPETPTLIVIQFNPGIAKHPAWAIAGRVPRKRYIGVRACHSMK